MKCFKCTLSFVLAHNIGISINDMPLAEIHSKKNPFYLRNTCFNNFEQVETHKKTITNRGKHGKSKKKMNEKKIYKRACRNAEDECVECGFA